MGISEDKYDRVCVCVLLVCMSVHHIQDLVSLGLVLQTAVRCHMDAADGIRGPLKSSSWLPSRHSSLLCYFEHV